MAVKKSLFEINQGIADIAARFDNCIVDGDKIINPETGECMSLEEIDKIVDDHEEKMKSCIYVYRRFDQQVAGIDGQIAYLKQQIKDLENHKNAILNRKERFAQYMITCTNGESWKAKDKSCYCYTRENTSTNIVDEDLIPAEFYTIEPVKKFDKNAIKEAIDKNGKTVPGAKITKSYSFITR